MIKSIGACQLNLHKPPILLTVMCIFILLISIPFASAIYYPDVMNNPDGLGVIDGTDYLIVNDSEISVFHSDSGTVTQKFINMPSADDAAILPNGDMAVVFTSGDVYIFDYDDYSGIFDWVEDHEQGDSWTLLGQLGTSAEHSLLVDAANNVFVSSGSSIYKFNYPLYSSGVWGSASCGIRSMDVHPDGIITGGYAGTSTDDLRIELVTESSYSIIKQADIYSYNYPCGVAVAENGDVYTFINYNYLGQHKGEFAVLDYSNNWAYSKQSTYYGYVGDCILDDDGVIYVTD